MNETEYHEKADIGLAELLEFTESLEGSYEIECELESGVLSVIMPDDKEYIINKHTPSKQIWVSSPYSGAGYFEYNGQNWMPKRSDAAKGRTLFEFIKDEIFQRLK